MKVDSFILAFSCKELGIKIMLGKVSFVVLSISVYSISSSAVPCLVNTSDPLFMSHLHLLVEKLDKIYNVATL